MGSTITIYLPTEILAMVKQHSEIDWALIAQKSLIEYAKKIAITDTLTQKSEMTTEDVSILDEEVKKSILDKYT